MYTPKVRCPIRLKTLTPPPLNKLIYNTFKQKNKKQCAGQTNGNSVISY